MNAPRKLIAVMSLCAATMFPHLASAVAISGQGTWETTLQARDLDGNLSTAEAYYDTVLGITWLADANYAMTSGYDADGRMTWVNANAWAASLNLNGTTGWRLPSTIDVRNDGSTYTNLYRGVDYGFNITSHSEMSHMFYITLGDKAFYSTSGVGPQEGYGLTNSGPFSNVQPFFYWSATAYASGINGAWDFGFHNGQQVDGNISNTFNAWAVHNGDVGVAPTTSTVPIPAAAWLLGSGLLGLIGISRRM